MRNARSIVTLTAALCGSLVMVAVSLPPVARAASIVPTPSEVAPGDSVRVAGVAKPKSTMNFSVVIGGSARSVGATQANSEGRYVHFFRVPTDAPGGPLTIVGGCEACGNGFSRVQVTVKLAHATAPPAAAPPRAPTPRAPTPPTPPAPPAPRVTQPSGTSGTSTVAPTAPPSSTPPPGCFDYPDLSECAKYKNDVKRIEQSRDDAAKAQQQEVDAHQQEIAAHQSAQFLRADTNAVANRSFQMRLTTQPKKLRGVMLRYQSGEETPFTFDDSTQTWIVTVKAIAQTTIFRVYPLGPAGVSAADFAKNVPFLNAGTNVTVTPTAAPPPTAAAGDCSANSSALYAYDGTLTRAEHQSAIWQVYNRFAGVGDCAGKKAYSAGPNMEGSDADALFQQLYRYACAEVKSAKIQRVFIVGFSRGAMMSIRFANDFPSCANGTRVTFIGAVDPVDSLMGGNFNPHKALLGGRAASSYKVYKINNGLGFNPVDNFFVVHATPGFARVEQVDNAEQRSGLGTADRHWMMNASNCKSGRDVEARLVRELQGLGVKFGPPSLQGGPEPCKM